ncbi:MAG: hypothetical protein L6R37_001184 [Teloschistes peruensis]|nr:MAG: hypothetical protein L6R37_001184 [Teloschistes peruensis]
MPAPKAPSADINLRASASPSKNKTSQTQPLSKAATSQVPTNTSPSGGKIAPSFETSVSQKASACRTLKSHVLHLTHLQAILQKHNRTFDEADVRMSFGPVSETSYWQAMKNESTKEISEVEEKAKGVRKEMVPYLAEKALGRPLPIEIVNMIHGIMDRPEKKARVTDNPNSLAAMAEKLDLKEEQAWDLEMAELYAEADAENTKEIMETLDRWSRHLDWMRKNGRGL